MSMLPRVVLLTPTPPSTTRRVLSRIIIVTSVISTMQLIPLLVEFRQMPLQRLLIGALFLLPSVMVLTFPLSTIWATDGIRRNPSPTPAERLAAARFAIIAVLVTLTLIGWVMPAANQEWRELAAPEWARPPARGVREVTLTELLQTPPPRIVEGRSADLLRREINNRLVIALLPAVLIWVRWGAHASPRRRWLWPLPAAIETIAALAIFMKFFLSSVVIEQTLGLGAGTGLWLAPAALLVAGMMRNVVSGRLRESAA